MSNKKKDQPPSKKALQRQHAQRFVIITSVLILLAAGWLWYDIDHENSDLSTIGQGGNVVVQVHDPGWSACRELKRVVNSLKQEYENRIHFLLIDINTSEGRSFAQLHEVGKVTLVFFNPEGKRIAILTGVQKQKFLRVAFDRAFKL